MDFLNACLPYLGVQGEAQVCDVIHACPTQRADVAFLLKAIPCLEQLDPLAGKRLLETIRADHLVVSFPAASLGGRSKGMVTNYESHFVDMVGDKPWSIERFVFPTELVFLVRKSHKTRYLLNNSQVFLFAAASRYCKLYQSLLHSQGEPFWLLVLLT